MHNHYFYAHKYFQVYPIFQSTSITQQTTVCQHGEDMGGLLYVHGEDRGGPHCICKSISLMCLFNDYMLYV